MSQIMVSGCGEEAQEQTIRRIVKEAAPAVAAIASAFVSTDGVRRMGDILSAGGVRQCRLIAGLDYFVTHPEALVMALDRGWQVRVGSGREGIFHPKLIVVGGAFGPHGVIRKVSGVYVGSSNLTRGGLQRNVECGWVSTSACPTSASDVFALMWQSSEPATQRLLRNYASRFAERARTRSVQELREVGVADCPVIPVEIGSLKASRPPERAAVAEVFAVAAWTGLQSFTGEYRFQVEFPRQAGEVIEQIIGVSARRTGRFDVYCPEDGSVREMQYGFYSANSMFRLNVPNDVPGVAEARRTRDGVALVERGVPGGAPLRLRIIKPGAGMNEVVGRSAALGTWGRTPTRLFGWF